GDRRLVAEEHPRPALAEGERLVVAPLRLAHHKKEEAAEEEEGQELDEHAQPVAELRRLLDLDVRGRDLLGRRTAVLEEVEDADAGLLPGGVLLAAALGRDGD